MGKHLVFVGSGPAGVKIAANLPRRIAENKGKTGFFPFQRITLTGISWKNFKCLESSRRKRRG